MILFLSSPSSPPNPHTLWMSKFSYSACGASFHASFQCWLRIWYYFCPHPHPHPTPIPSACQNFPIGQVWCHFTLVDADYEYDITLAPTKNSYPTLHTVKEKKAFNIAWKSFHANFWCWLRSLMLFWFNTYKLFIIFILFKKKTSQMTTIHRPTVWYNLQGLTKKKIAFLVKGNLFKIDNTKKEKIKK